MNKQEISLVGMKENIKLAEFTTFKIGGPARYFFIAKNMEEIIMALDWAQDKKLDVCILGGGSNLLISDAGFNGLIIKDENINININNNIIQVGGGLNMGYFVSQCADLGLTGMEFLAGIPGTLGGAVRGNAGAWGHGIGELVDKVIIFDGEKVRDLFNPECLFKYRTSVMKEKKYIILTVKLKLIKGIKEESQKLIKEYLQKRTRKHPLGQPSAGSVFKNIEIRNIDTKKVKKYLEETDEDFDEVTKYGKLPVGYLIEHLNLRGTKIGGAEISMEHANFIVNTGAATAADVVELISFIKQQARDKTGIQLEEEVQLLGF